MPTPERFLTCAAIKDEGPFLLEWVAWYKMLGFDIVIAHNDCTDHTPQLLQCLSDAGWLSHVEHSPRAGQPPKNSAHSALRRHALVKQTDWLFVCDIDEFLVLHRGDGTIHSFLDDMGRDFRGMAFHWKCFGNGGWKKYRDGLVHRQFRRTGASDTKVNANFKTLFRTPRDFQRLSDHAPVNPDLNWSAPENRIVTSDRCDILKFHNGPHPVRFTPPDQITHVNAQLNHYVIRSDESFDLKRGRPSASALKNRYTPQFYRARNRNGHKDLSATAYEGWFDATYAEICAIPEAMRLHHLCCADYVARLCETAGKRPQDDPRWQMHMKTAQSPDA